MNMRNVEDEMDSINTPWGLFSIVMGFYLVMALLGFVLSYMN